MRQLRDRVAVVTGAASGIGRACALELARHGCHVAIADIDGEGLSSLAEQLRAADRRVSTHTTDVSDRASMERLRDQVLEAHGAVHIVVNNAGVGLAKPLVEQSLDELEWIVGINLWGVVYGCRLFLPHLLEADEAHIVNVSSMASFAAFPGLSTYSATKSAVQALSEALWQELGGSSVGVTVVHPGGVRTNIARNTPVSASRSQEQAQQDFERVVRRSPESVARRIVRAIVRRKFRVRVGAEAYLLDWLRRLMPITVLRVFGWLYLREERRT